MVKNATCAAEEVAGFLAGALEVLYALCFVLERNGLLTRQQIADTLATVQAQIVAQEGPSKRTAVAELMVEAFRLPTAGAEARARFRVIAGDGG